MAIDRRIVGELSEPRQTEQQQAQPERVVFGKTILFSILHGRFWAVFDLRMSLLLNAHRRR